MSLISSIEMRVKEEMEYDYVCFFFFKVGRRRTRKSEVRWPQSFFFVLKAKSSAGTRGATGWWVRA